MVKIGETVKITQNLSGHPFKIGDAVRVFRVFNNNYFDVCIKGDCWTIHLSEFKTITEYMQQMRQAVLTTATRLAKANNTVTTLELKTELRKTHPSFYWIQTSKGPNTGVSEYMNELAKAGRFTYTDNGNHRVYSLIGFKPKAPAIKVTTPKSTTSVTNTSRITRKKAYDLMKGSKGHFFTAVFIKKDNTQRTINCQFMKDQGNSTNYIRVKEAGKLKTGENPIRQINIDTLLGLRIGGQNYRIRK